MAQLIWTREARFDLDEITDYIARDSVHYAQAVAGKLFETGHSIAEHPRMGRMVPEIQRDDIRERFVYSYRLIYHLHADQIIILAIIHGSRLLLENIGDRLQSMND